MRLTRALLAAAFALAACTSSTPTQTNNPVADAPAATVMLSALSATPLPATATTSPLPATLTPAPTDTPGAPTTTPLPSDTAAPTATVAPPATEAPGQTITLLFTGDINPGRCPAQIALARDDFTVSYEYVGEVLRAADITVGSLDGSISDQSAPSICPQTMNLIGPSRTVEGLSFAGFDLITIATNHAKDCGSQGWRCEERAFNDTRANLGAAGILPVGGGANLAAARAPVIIERGGVRFAFLGITEINAFSWASDTVAGTAPLSEEALPGLLADITAARALAEVVIVEPHWGVEYADQPSEYQQRWAQAMLDAGATLVVGNHPHTVQPVVGATGADGRPQLVAYALGNFIFDQGPWRNRQGVLLRATFTGAVLSGYELLPIHIYSLYQPRFAEATEAADILARTK